MTYLFLFIAGVLIVFSPCILPALPLIAVGALQRGRMGPLMLAAGLIIGFVVVGTALSVLSSLLGFTTVIWREIAAWIMICFGLMLLISVLKTRWQFLLAPMAGMADSVGRRVDRWGLLGQLFIGMLLGVLWSPCVGPALGAAITLASTSQHWLQAASMMMVFAVGTSVPLLAVSYISRSFVKRLIHVSPVVLPALGAFFILVGICILMHWDQSAQAFLFKHIPHWWLAIITRY